jgi:hypothetical protein
MKLSEFQRWFADILAGNFEFDEDAYEIEQMTEGHTWQEWLAAKLKAEGFPARVPPLKIRPTRSSINRYTDEADLIIDLFPEVKVEVKAKSLEFDGTIENYPFQTLIFERVLTWQRKREKPDYIVWISTPTKAIVGVSTRPEIMDRLTVKKILDRTRSKSRKHYMIDKMYCLTWEGLLEHIRTNYRR